MGPNVAVRGPTTPTYPGQKLTHLRHERVQVALCQLDEPLRRPLRGEQVLEESVADTDEPRVLQPSGPARLTQRLSSTYGVFHLLALHGKHETTAAGHTGTRPLRATPAHGPTVTYGDTAPGRAGFAAFLTQFSQLCCEVNVILFCV